MQILDNALSEGQLSMTEHGERVKAATTAMTLGELQDLVSDLQNSNAPVQLPDLKKPPRAGQWLGHARRGGRCAGGPRHRDRLGSVRQHELTVDFTSDPGAKSDGIEPRVLTPPRQLQSLGGLTGLLEQMRQRFGDTMGYSLVVYPEYAVLARPDPNDERRELQLYLSRRLRRPVDIGQERQRSCSSTLAPSTSRRPWRPCAEPPRPLGLEEADVDRDSTYLTVDPTREPQTPGELTLRANVSSEFGSGRSTFAADGAIKQIDYVGD